MPTGVYGVHQTDCASFRIHPVFEQCQRDLYRRVGDEWDTFPEQNGYDTDFNRVNEPCSSQAAKQGTTPKRNCSATLTSVL